MPRLVLFELAMLLTPFVLFGIYRLAVRDAEVEGRKAWPINLLFGAGVVLAILGWLFLLLREGDNREVCRGPESYDSATGKVVPGEEYDCNLGLRPRGEPLGDRSN